LIKQRHHLLTTCTAGHSAVFAQRPGYGWCVRGVDMPHRNRPRRDRDIDIVQPARPAARPQAKVACGCSCGACNSGAHCHNMGTGCNVRWA